MTQHITAIYEAGVLRPLDPLDLQDREVVSLVVEALPPAEGANANGGGPTLYDLLDEAGLIGAIKDGPPDLSTDPKYMEGFGKSE